MNDLPLRRDRVFVWTTWVTRLLAGESSCEWASWFKAHHEYEKRPSDFDAVKWRIDHAGLVARIVEERRADGWSVRIEDQNGFRLEGAGGVVLSGKPDVIAVRDREAVIVDAKTGKRRDSDVVQVGVYMLVAPLVFPHLDDAIISGQVQYRDGIVEVPADFVDEGFRERFKSLMGRIGADAPAMRVPSHGECRFCDIPGSCCAERIDQPRGTTSGGEAVF